MWAVGLTQDASGWNALWTASRYREADPRQRFNLIEEMFSLEQAWKDLSPEARFTLRQEKLRPLLDNYWKLLDSFEAAEGTALSKAKTYSLNQKQALNAVLLDGRLERDYPIICVNLLRGVE